MAEHEYFHTEAGRVFYWKDGKLHITSINTSESYPDPTPAPLADTNPKTAYGKAKPPMQYVPPVALLELGLVMEFGASKYGPMNWREDPISASTFYNALMRHAFLYWDGADRDLESKLKHLSHIMSCCAILLDAEASGTLIDDRPEKGSAELHIIQNTRTLDAD
jgi:hypothetical protein